MTESLTPKVTRVSASPLISATGTLIPQIRVEFMVGEHGPFFTTIPEAEFTAARAQQEMEKVATPLRQLAGG